MFSLQVQVPLLQITVPRLRIMAPLLQITAQALGLGLGELEALEELALGGREDA